MDDREDTVACSHKRVVVTDLPATSPEVQKGLKAWVETCSECGERRIRTAPLPKGWGKTALPPGYLG